MTPILLPAARSVDWPAAMQGECSFTECFATPLDRPFSLLRSMS